VSGRPHGKCAIARMVVGFASVAALVIPAGASAAPLVGVDQSCVAPAGNPAPGTAAWYQRDTENQYCAGLRIRDQLLSPAFGFGNLTQGAALYAHPDLERSRGHVADRTPAWSWPLVRRMPGVGPRDRSPAYSCTRAGLQAAGVATRGSDD